MNDYFYEKHRWDNEYKDTLSCLTPQLVEPNSSKLILHDEGHVSADYNLPFRLGSLIVKNESGDIIYAQSPIKDELWNSKDKSEGLMWATDYYFNFTKSNTANFKHTTSQIRQSFRLFPMTILSFAPVRIHL